MEESVIWCLSQVEPTFFLWALVVAVAAAVQTESPP